MPKNEFIWIMTIALLMLFIVFIFSNARSDYMYRSNSGQHTLKTYKFASPDPVYVTPSNIRVIRDDLSDDRLHDDVPPKVLSPTCTNRESTVYDIPVGNFSSEFEIGGRPKYKFDIGDRHFRSVGEELCCKIFEEYLERQVLVNRRPNFMRNPETGRNLELDVYDPITKVAIEYNGVQHYEPTAHFNMDRDSVNKQAERDVIKAKLCKDNGIKLIVVPYTVDSGYKDINGKWHSVSRNRYIREEKLRSYIVPFLEEYC